MRVSQSNPEEAAMNARSRCLSLPALLAGLALALCTGTALADAYAVLSLVGDHVTIVAQGPETGSRLDQDAYQILPVKETALDDYVVVAAEDAVRKARPGATVTKLRANDRAMHGVGEGWLAPNSDALKSLVAFVTKAVPAAPDSHLVLILPLRAEPQFLTYAGYRGSGSVGGLGFYLGDAAIDREAIGGFLGVFANLQVVLVNLQTSAIEGQQRVVAGNAFSGANSKGAWDALSAERKFAVLQTLMQGELARAMPGVLAMRKP